MKVVFDDTFESPYVETLVISLGGGLLIFVFAHVLLAGVAFLDPSMTVAQALEFKLYRLFLLPISILAMFSKHYFQQRRM